MTFGQLISTGRKRLGVSQKQLAARVLKEDGKAITPQYLNDIERDRRNPPSEQVIDQLATILDISKDHLCLAAGTISSDLRKHSSDEPKKIAAAFRKLRKDLSR
jgi:transcriptional regulator with XRE-family HTH domain